MKLFTNLNLKVLAKLSSEILDLTHKAIDTKIHFRVNLEESMESFNNGEYVDNFDLIEGLYYDIFDARAHIKNKLDAIKTMINNEQDLLNYEEATTSLRYAEDSYQIVCDIANEVVAQMDKLYGLEAHLVNEDEVAE